MKKENKIVIIIIFCLIMIDQFSKFLLSNKSWTIQNQDNGYHIMISIIIVIMIFRYIFSNNIYIKKRTKIVLSFAIAGAISNVIDRIWNNSVILIINIGHHIEINIAYIYIIIAWLGMALIMTNNTVKMIYEHKNKAERNNIKNENKNR